MLIEPIFKLQYSPNYCLISNDIDFIVNQSLILQSKRFILNREQNKLKDGGSF